jgi:hypothetical protein
MCEDAELLARLVELEADVCYQKPSADHDPEFRHEPGRVPVLLSAPHGAVHTRRGQVKPEDEYTAGLCRLVAERTGAHALYARRRSRTDPNWYRDVPYKRCLERIVTQAGICFVLDLHAANVRRDFGIALGTMRGASCPQHRRRIIQVLEAHGTRRDGSGLGRLDVDRQFTARGLRDQETITRYAWERLQIPAAQFELHPGLRIVERREDASYEPPFRGDPERICWAVQALSEIVGLVSDGRRTADL